MQIGILERICDNTNNRGVAPVISVILMVAVAVIIASVVAVFALGLGGDVNDVGPQTAFTFEYDDTCEVTLSHEKGDDIENSQLRLAGAALQYTSYGSIDWQGNEDTTVTAGDSANVLVLSDETLRVIWRDKNNRSTAVLGKYEVPEIGTCGAITSLTETHAGGDYTGTPDENGKVTVSVGASGVGGSVYVTIEDTATYGSYSDAKTLSLSDGTATTDFETCRADVGDGETVTVTLYESSSQTNQLDQKTVTANSKTGGNGRDGTPACA